MERENYFFSFICLNEKRTNGLQLLFEAYINKDNTITKKPLNKDEIKPKLYPIKTIESSDKSPLSNKLTDLQNALERVQDSYLKSENFNDYTPLTHEEISLKLNGLFLKAASAANRDNYLPELLNFHIKEYKGDSIDFIEHIKSIKNIHLISNAIQIWIENAAQNILKNPNFYKMENGKKSGLERVEKLFIIKLLQQNGLFPKYDPRLKGSNESVYKLISDLTDISPSEVKKLLREKVERTVNINELTLPEITSKIKNLENIRPTINGLEISELSDSLTDLEKKVRSKQEKLSN